MVCLDWLYLHVEETVVRCSAIIINIYIQIISIIIVRVCFHKIYYFFNSFTACKKMVKQNNWKNYLYSHSILAQEQPSDRSLYFHALASNTENRVPLNVLNNATAWEQNAESYSTEFQELGTRQSQAIAQAMDSNGNLFFGLEDPIAIGCWDFERPFTRDNMRIVAQNDQTLQFVSGMKVILNKKGKEELWSLSCRFQVNFFKIKSA